VFRVKRVILITGTPCVGKTSVAKMLSVKLKAFYINLTELALNEGLILEKDKKRGSLIVDENLMRKRIVKMIEKCEEDVIVDGHYAASVIPKNFVMYTFVLRRDPIELRNFMKKCGFSGQKLWENLAAEILDVCLVEALNMYGKGKVCELDVTGKSVEEVVENILLILNGSKKCCVGIVDWLGKLEKEGLLEEFLKI